MSTDREKRKALVKILNNFEYWMDVAEKKGWVTPLGRDIGNHPANAWINYWVAMDEKERGLREGRPVPPHRSA